jgi:hypothetical protein
MKAAAELIKTGYPNCAGRANTMVEVYEQSSKKFWKEASIEENEPRRSASTSFRRAVISLALQKG